ncbi:MAG TPA: AAA family ATPase [Pyrinomonadaceae bacterium]|nr:AAA family ATPase [Pyrinomonadaceae bacterium]
MLQLRALGRAEIATNVKTLTPSQEIVFASALYLVLERDRRTPRGRFAEILWPNVPPSVRGHRLRQTLLQLKKLGFPVIADGDRVGLATQEILSDIDRIEVDETAALQHGQSLEFLPGYSPRFSEPFRDWVDLKRSEVNSICSRALLATLGIKRGRADWKAVEGIARTVLRLDPFNESAVLAMAEAFAMRGQKREAVTMLDDYLREVGGNADMRLPTTLLRKRIIDSSPSSVSSPPLPDPVYVGRQVELETLTCRLKEAQRGRGGACILLGEPGIGKSRLAAEIAKFAGLQGIRNATVSCQRPNVDRPLSVLADLVPLLRDMPGALGCSQDTLLALRRLTEFDTRATELSVLTTEAYAVHRTLRNAIFDLLGAVTEEGSLLLILDDVQWIDRTSQDILADICVWSKQNRLLVVLNSRRERPELLESFVRANTEVIELNALTASAAEILLNSIVKNAAPSHDSNKSRWLLDVGEGNPFFLQELAKHWIESAGSVQAPSSVSKVLRDRLARLSPVSLRVLQACTVLGQSATVERVDNVLEYPSHELLGAIQELSAAGMLSCSTDSTEITPLSLRTRHDLLSGAVLEGLTAAARAFLHRRAGIVLEKELSGDSISTALLWGCAFHWHNAGERDRALSVVRSCCEHLLEVGLPQDASDALKRALDYCSNDEQRMSILTRQVDALQMAGQWEESINVIRQCRQLRAMSPDSGSPHDSLEIMMFEAFCRTNLKTLELVPAVMVCVDCKDAPTAHRIDAAIIALKLACDVDARLMDTIYVQIAPLLAETKPDDVGRLEVEMVYHSTRGDAGKGLAAASALVDAARKTKDGVTLAKALSNAANSFRINGIPGEAENFLRELIDYSVQHHAFERAAIGMLCMSKLALASGDLALARRMLEQTKTLPIATENLRCTAEQHFLEARVSILEGKLDEAARAFSYVQGGATGHTSSRRAANLAMTILLGIAQSEDPDILGPSVTELEAIHVKLRAMGLQDFETECLCLGLKAIGRESQGIALVREYLQKHRRERRPAARSLTALLSSLPATVASEDAVSDLFSL